MNKEEYHMKKVENKPKMKSIMGFRIKFEDLVRREIYKLRNLGERSSKNKDKFIFDKEFNLIRIEEIK
jgi:hypothetical protein